MSDSKTGTIDDKEREWVQAKEFDVDNPDFRDGKDYFMMTYEERSLDTDLLEAHPGHVITGVRLRKLGGHLNLEIRVSTLIYYKKYQALVTALNCNVVSAQQNLNLTMVFNTLGRGGGGLVVGVLAITPTIQVRTLQATKIMNCYNA